MTEEHDHPALAAILDYLGSQICLPLDGLRSALGQVIEEPEAILPPNQRAHASTMIILCDELGRLTRDTLGCGGPGDPQA